MPLVGLMAVHFLAAVALAACSDDTGTAPENEAGADGPSTWDVVQTDAQAGGVDASDAAKVDAMPDAGPDAKADVADAGSDAQDAAVVDVADAGSDAQDATVVDVADAEPDAQDATVVDVVDAAPDVADAAPDAYVCPTALKTYPQQYAAAYCYGVGNCCPGYGEGGFDLPTCLSENQVNGWDNTLPEDPTVVCRGDIDLDEDASTACLAQLAAYPCGTEVSAATFAALIHACQNVLRGTLQVDAGGCVSSFECVDGAYCAYDPDAGVPGTCLPLAGDGGACSSDDMCRSASSGQPTQFCSSDLTSAATGICTPQLLDNADCSGASSSWYDKVCASLQCGDPQTCGSPAGLDFCPAYPPPDSGTE